MSWIRIYVLLRATSQRISSADVVTDLSRPGFDYSSGSVSRIMRSLETKGYLAKSAPPNKRRSPVFYTATARGRDAAKSLRMLVRGVLASD
jgi:DNA-binding MarR family transcriptional regulator